MGAQGMTTDGKHQMCQYLREQKSSDCELPALDPYDVRKASLCLSMTRGPGTERR